MASNSTQPIERPHANAEALLEKPSKDDQLASLLASGCGQAEAARAAGCSRATVARRLSDPAFADRILAFRREMVRGLIGSMADRLPQVMGKLFELATGPTPYVVSLKAGIALMSIAPAYFKLGESIDKDDRNDRLDLGDEAEPTPP